MPSRETTGLPTGGQASWQIGFGMIVTGADGADMGQVWLVRDADFLLRRDSGPDVFVPYGAVTDVSGNRVFLTVSAREVDRQGWATGQGAA